MFAVGTQLLRIATIPVFPSLLSVLLFSDNSFLLPRNTWRSCSGRRVRLHHTVHSSCAAFLSFFQSEHRLSLLWGIPLCDAEQQINSCQFAGGGKRQRPARSEPYRLVGWVLSSLPPAASCCLLWVGSTELGRKAAVGELGCFGVQFQADLTIIAYCSIWDIPSFVRAM